MNSLIDGNVRKFVSFEFIIPGYSYMTGYIENILFFISDEAENRILRRKEHRWRS